MVEFGNIEVNINHEGAPSLQRSDTVMSINLYHR